MDDVSAGQAVAAGDLGLAPLTAAQGAAFFQQLRSRGRVYGAVQPSSVGWAAFTMASTFIFVISFRTSTSGIGVSSLFRLSSTLTPRHEIVKMKSSLPREEAGSFYALCHSRIFILERVT